MSILSKSTLRGKSAAWAVPLTLVSGEIDAVGTPFVSDSIVDSKPLYAKSAAAAKNDKISIVYVNGVTGTAAKRTTTIDLPSGTEVVGGADSGSDVDKLSITYAESEKWIITKVKPGQTQPHLICVPSGENIDAAEEGFFFMIALVTSDIDLSQKAEEVLRTTIEWSGKSYTATEDGETALLINLASVTEIGGGAVDPPVLLEADVTALLAGKLVWKAAA